MTMRSAKSVVRRDARMLEARAPASVDAVPQAMAVLYRTTPGACEGGDALADVVGAVDRRQAEDEKKYDDLHPMSSRAMPAKGRFGERTQRRGSMPSTCRRRLADPRNGPGGRGKVGWKVPNPAGIPARLPDLDHVVPPLPLPALGPEEGEEERGRLAGGDLDVRVLDPERGRC